MAESFRENEGVTMLPEIVCQAIPHPNLAEVACTAGRGENAGIEIVIPIAIEREPKIPSSRDKNGDERGL
jgi:hypothetical protein